ncbi:hypothetical protein PIB30_087782 [Stylosanthes scabra]|uniref:Uncharacterized protein n=1 Tax=Stylosanthes scabra TaxID=79078 RepID=A0ABU6SU37_9FABA|nr:hypothetical protein [Stylosanthes scabra]
MARDGPFPPAKGKAKAFGPPTRVTPRLAALSAATSSLPPKKRPIQKAAGEGTSKAAAKSFRKRFQRLAATGRTSFQAPKIQEVIAVISDSEPKSEMVKEAENVEEDPEEDPVEEPQEAGIEEEDEEDPKEDPMEENDVEEGVRVEDDFVDYWALVRFDSENSVGNDYRFAGNAGPINSSVGSCTEDCAIFKCGEDIVGSSGTEIKMAKIGVEVAKKDARNEEITKKSLEANSDGYAYAPMVTCVRIAKTWASRLSWNRTLSYAPKAPCAYAPKAEFELINKGRPHYFGRALHTPFTLVLVLVS